MSLIRQIESNCFMSSNNTWTPIAIEAILVTGYISFQSFQCICISIYNVCVCIWVKAKRNWSIVEMSWACIVYSWILSGNVIGNDLFIFVKYLKRFPFQHYIIFKCVESVWRVMPSTNLRTCRVISFSRFTAYGAY